MILKINRYEFGYRLLIGYIYILLFGGWILKIVGVPSNVGLIIISIVDVLPLGIWLLSNPSFRIRTEEIFVDTFSFWLLWITVLGLLLYSSYQHGGSLNLALVHWGVLVRYIPLACIVVSINKHVDVGDKIMRHFKIITIILITIGYLCIVLGERSVYLLPIIPENATGERELLEGRYSTIFANTIDYAFILILLYTIFVYKAKLTSVWIWGGTLVFLIPIFKTGSVASILVFSAIASYRITQGRNAVRYYVIAVLVISTLVVGYKYWDWIELLIENTRYSRLGMLTLTAPDFLSEMSLDTLLGVGNDGYVVLDKVNGYEEQVSMLKYAIDGDISAFGDVYWVALLVFHGLLGLGIIVYLYYSLFRLATDKSYSDAKFDYSRIIKCFFFSIMMLAFFNQVIAVKTFALVFWVFLAIIYNKKI